MPYLASLGGDENLSFEYLKNLYESILLRDVVIREKIRNVRFLENLSVYLADNTGSLFSASNISKYLKSQKIQMPVQTVISYLKALESAYLIHRVQRKEIGGLKIFEIGEKYFFEDLGLRNTLARKDPVSDKAKLMENAVYLSLLQQGYSVHAGKLEKGEVDFIANKQNELIYIQVCWRLSGGETWNREIDRLLEIKDNFLKYIVTMDTEFSGQNFQGIKIESLENFMYGP
jgi:predicted AAA+ superfamily ATPase